MLAFLKTFVYNKSCVKEAQSKQHNLSVISSVGRAPDS